MADMGITIRSIVEYKGGGGGGPRSMGGGSKVDWGLGGHSPEDTKKNQLKIKTLKQEERYQKDMKKYFGPKNKSGSFLNGLNFFFGATKGGGAKGMGMMGGIITGGAKGASAGGAMGGVAGTLGAILGVLMQSKVFMAGIETVLDVIGSFTDIALVAMLILIGKIPQIYEQVVGVAKGIFDFAVRLKDIVYSIGGLGKIMDDAWVKIDNWLTNNLSYEKICSAIGEVYTSVKDWLVGVWDTSDLGQGVKAFTTFVDTYFTVGNLKEIGAVAIGAFDSVKTGFINFIDDPVGGMKSWGGKVLGSFSGVTDMIKGWKSIDIPGYFKGAFASLISPDGTLFKLNNTFYKLFTSSLLLTTGLSVVGKGFSYVLDGMRRFLSWIKSLVPNSSSIPDIPGWDYVSGLGD